MSKQFVAIYIRVSTTHQAEEGFSLEAQEEKLRKIAKLNDYQIYKVYADKGISGKDTIHRPAFQEMMKDMQSKLFSKILVMKLDRISRSVADLENIIKQLQKYNCGFESASEKIDTTSSMGLMFIRLLGVFAQFERERISEISGILIILSKSSFNFSSSEFVKAIILAFLAFASSEFERILS